MYGCISGKLLIVYISTQAWLVALWALDSFKKTQREEHGEPWVLPAAPKVEFSSEALARRELIAALDSWDEERLSECDLVESLATPGAGQE